MNRRQLTLVKSINKMRILFLTNKNLLKYRAKLIKQWIRVIYACDISVTAEIPLTCVFHHAGLGCVIGKNVKMGNNCQVYSNVVIGSKDVQGKARGVIQQLVKMLLLVQGQLFWGI